MPGTVNGIGTTYYGKKNRLVRQGICPHCHKEVELASYETRLWFVIVFVPVIPLRRKQIIDYCSSCTMHRAVPAGDWMKASETALREALQRAEESPDDVDAALGLFGTFVAFQRHEEATQYAETLAGRFGHNAAAQWELGCWHSAEGREDAAQACLLRALEIDPEHRNARQAAALGYIERGQPAKAQELLSAMERTDAKADPAVLVFLADAYQTQGDHEHALETYRTALQYAPQLARDRQLRKRIRKSESALGRTETIAPASPLNYRRLWIWAGVAAVVVVVAATTNHYAKTHQELHVVNSRPDPVTVAIDAGEEHRVAAGAQITVPIAEGQHKAILKREDGSTETVEFSVTNRFSQRFSGDTLFVLNVDGAATLVWQEVYYSEKPNPDLEGDFRLHFGVPFVVFRDVDFKFEEFPEEIQIKADPEKRTGVNWLDLDPATVSGIVVEQLGPTELMRFAEIQLRIDPSNEQMIRLYHVYGTLQNALDRCRRFLEQGLDRRPVVIQWHRTYQDICERTGHEEAMVQRYETMLADAPEDSALLYLRGRTVPRSSEAESYFDRAIAADPQNPYPYFAKSYQLALEGDFESARLLCSKACELKPDDTGFSEFFFDIRMALREYADLEKEVRKAHQENQFDLSAHRNLLQVLVFDGREEDARRAHDELIEFIQSTLSGKADEYRLRSLMTLQYLTGDMEGYLESAQDLKSPLEDPSDLLIAHFELGNLDEVETLLEEKPAYQDWLRALLLSLAWQQAGDQAKADSWHEEAVKSLEAGGPDDGRVAELLMAVNDFRLDDVDEISVPRAAKAALLVAMAARLPDQRAELLTRAEKLNVPGLFPYRFLKGAIDWLTE